MMVNPYSQGLNICVAGRNVKVKAASYAKPSNPHEDMEMGAQLGIDLSCLGQSVNFSVRFQLWHSIPLSLVDLRLVFTYAWHGPGVWDGFWP